MEIKFRHTIVLVKDIEESKKFYRDIIGLSVVNEYETIVWFEDNFTIHKAELFYEYINKPYQGEKLGYDNIDIYFTTSDLETMEQKLMDGGVKFIHGIKQHDWGEKVIRVYDPDGHIVEIGDNHE